jgi:integrase
MRLPNGYGTIYKLSGKRRRPFIARKTVNWGNDGKQVLQTIGYFETKQKAIKALADYNENPYDINASSVTFSELYEKWLDRRTTGETLTATNLKAYKMAYNLSKPLYDLRFVDIRTEHMQDVINGCGKRYDTVRKMRVLYNQLFDYAMEHDIVTKKYVDYIKLPGSREESSRKPFTKEEIQKLWDNIDRMDFIDTILIMIYTGLRPGEMVLIDTGKIFLDERYMKGGIKTAAGKNRIIPINKKIHPLIKNRIAGGQKYLVANSNNEPMSYFTYYDCKFNPIMKQLEMDHCPHDCRHTFGTLMDNAGANKLSIKRIMGHASKDITDKVYTHKDIEELVKAIDMI